MKRTDDVGTHSLEGRDLKKADPGERFRHLSPAKRALFLKAMRNKIGRVDGHMTIPRRRSEGVCPLSFAQQSFWFMDQLDPLSNAFTSTKSLRLSGNLNLISLEQAINEILRRHDALRTTFPMIDGQPVQSIRPELRILLPIIDLEGTPSHTLESRIAQLMRDMPRIFDLTCGPILQFSLLRLSPQEHLMLFTIHDIISDGWSRGVLTRESGALYRTFSSGEPSFLPELPIQYADFAIWQRELVENGTIKNQLDYWKKQLEGVPLMDLSMGRRRSATLSYQTAMVPMTLGLDLIELLKKLARREEVTLFMILLAAFQVLLARYTAQDDMVVGIPVSGRDRLETEGVIGFFVNILPLRVKLTGTLTFLELLRQVKNLVLDAFMNQDMPLEKIVEALHPERTAGHLPLVQVSASLLNVPQESLKLSDLSLSYSPVEVATMRFDLALSMTSGDDETQLRGFLAYNTDIFEVDTIKRMVGHFVTLLRSIIADPDQCVWRLPWLMEEEEHQLLLEWNHTP